MSSPPRHATSIIDPALLARIVKGDQQAFSQLYDHSNTLLFTLALRILGSREDAAELLQDVYLEIWRKVARYDVGRGTPVAWLVTLTRSRALDRLRARTARRQRRPQFPLREAGLQDSVVPIREGNPEYVVSGFSQTLYVFFN